MYLPPYLASVITLRVVVCAPPPQVFEHDGQPAHGETTQLTGQCFVLHAFDCESAGQRLPPFLALVTTFRLRLALPPPHFLQQDVHLPQLLTWHLCVCDAVQVLCTCTSASDLALDGTGLCVRDRHVHRCVLTCVQLCSSAVGKLMSRLFERGPSDLYQYGLDILTTRTLIAKEIKYHKTSDRNL